MYGYRAALAVVGLWLAACSSVAQEDFDAELAEALCERYVRCGVSDDANSCERNQLEGFVGQLALNERYGTAFQAGRMRYDAEAARACLEKIRTGSCDLAPLSTWMVMEGVGMSADCRFLVGPVEDGEHCYWSGECGAGSGCTTSDPFSCGRCEPLNGAGTTPPFPSLCEEGLVFFESTCREPLTEGQSCGNAGVFASGPCAPGLFCDHDSKVCQRLASVGQSCDSQNPCGWSLLCIANTCQAPKGTGAACAAQSAGFLTVSECKLELFCDADFGTLGKCRELLGEGSPCRNDRECDRGLYCDGVEPYGTQRGLCRRSALEDEDCTGRACDGRFYCSEASRTCQPRRHSGESCGGEHDACVLGTWCDQGTCSGLNPTCGPTP